MSGRFAKHSIKENYTGEESSCNCCSCTYGHTWGVVNHFSGLCLEPYASEGRVTKVDLLIEELIGHEAYPSEDKFFREMLPNWWYGPHRNTMLQVFLTRRGYK